jgi:hypothetical protein
MLSIVNSRQCPLRDGVTSHVRASLHPCIRQISRIDDYDHPSHGKVGMSVEIGTTTKQPSIDPTHDETILLTVYLHSYSFPA